MAQTNSMRHIIIDEISCPRYFVVYPKYIEPDSFLGKVAHKGRYIFRYKEWMKKKVKLVFMCPVCNEFMPCGPKGTGYSLLIPTKELQQIAPALRASCQLLKVANMATQMFGYTLPVPTSDLISLNEQLTAELLGWVPLLTS
jgi:hypothetical protein